MPVASHPIKLHSLAARRSAIGLCFVLDCCAITRRPRTLSFMGMAVLVLVFSFKKEKSDVRYSAKC